MDELLKSALKDDEKLLWSGKPESFETLDKTNKPAFTKKAVISAVAAILLSIVYTFLVAKSNNFKIGVVIVIFAIALFVPLAVLLDANKLKKSILYAVTDQRLITVADSAKGVEYSAIKTAAFKTDADGHTSLLCGADALELPPDKWRAQAVTGVCLDDSAEVCERYAMYALPNAEKLKEILAPYLSLK